MRCFMLLFIIIKVTMIKCEVDFMKDFDMSHAGLGGLGKPDMDMETDTGPKIPLNEKELEGAALSEEDLAVAKKNEEGHTFQAEVHRLMDIIINSVYTEKEVFIRELISNANDALEKARFLGISKPEYLKDNAELHIKIHMDKKNKIISITDTGIGMTRADLISHLGTLARSGTSNFLEAISKSDDVNLIGQFGVGFYSAFLVSDKVNVVSRHIEDDQHIWISTADKGFSVAADPRGNTLGRGTQVILYVKDDSTSFLDEKKLKECIVKYSQFIPFPIYLSISETKTREVPIEPESCCEGADCCKNKQDAELEDCCKDKDENCCENEDMKDSECCKNNAIISCCKRLKPCCEDNTDDCCEDIDESCCENEDGEEVESECCDKQKALKACCEAKAPKTKTVEETVHVWKRVNDQLAIWLRNRESIKEEEYNSFYKSLTKDYADPLTHSHFNAEGEIDFKALIFIPKHAPNDIFENYFSKTSSIKMYVRRVLVSDKNEGFLPNYLHFIKGVVDSDDLPVNVARENLQSHKMFQAISKKLVRKSLELLKKMSKDENKEFEAKKKEVEECEESEKEKKQKEYDSFKSKYQTFYEQFSKYLKLGCYEDNTNRNKLAKLLRFTTSNEPNTFMTIDAMIQQNPNSNIIYYASGETTESLLKSPQMQVFLKKKIPVLLLTEAMDEPCIQRLTEYDGKRFESIQKADIQLEQSDDEKKLEEKIKSKYQPLVTYMEGILKGKVMKVDVSKSLIKHPCAVVASKYGYSPYMEKVMKTQTFSDPMQMQMMKSNRVFEINPRHHIIKQMLDTVVGGDFGDLNGQVETMYQVALMASGFDIENPSDFSSALYGMVGRDMGVDNDVGEVDVSDVDDGPADEIAEDDAADDDVTDDDAADDNSSGGNEEL